MDVMMSVGAAAVVLVAALAVLVAKLFSSGDVREVDVEWLRGFTTEQYRPMERLLSQDDIEFLRSQPGYAPEVERAFRKERRIVFRAYLRLLARDFDRFHLALRTLLRDAAEDHPDLAKALVQQKAMFIAGLWLAQVRLSLHALGVGSVDVRGLVSALDTMHRQLRGLLPVSQAAS